MYRNVIFYNSFSNQLEDYTNTISVNIPLQFSNFSAYRIEVLRANLLPKKDHKSTVFFGRLEYARDGRIYTDILAKNSVAELKTFAQDELKNNPTSTLVTGAKIKQNDSADIITKTIATDLYNTNVSPLTFTTNYVYILSDNDNDSIVLNTNTHCNIIGMTKIDDNNIFYEGNWVKPNKKDVIKLYLVGDDFSKLVISKFYINIKLIYEY